MHKQPLDDPRKYRFSEQFGRFSLWRHTLHVFIIITGTGVISLFAVFYALGYQINWTTFSVQQTGIIRLESDLSSFPASVQVNGAKEADALPFIYRKVFPGVYQVSLTRPGYQEWARTTRVEANRVASYRHILMIRENPPVVALTKNPFENEIKPDIEGIEVSENELRIGGHFITRTSSDILWAQWFPGRSHVVYQAGTNIWIAEPDGQSTQKLLAVDGSYPVQIAFLNDGRVLAYKNLDVVQAIELY